MGLFHGLLALMYGNAASGEMTEIRTKTQAKRDARLGKNAAAITSGKTLRVWRWDAHTTKAHTKSEARAAFKKKLGIKRLPTGANVVVS